MTLTNTDTPLTGAALYALTGGQNTLIVGPLRSGRTTTLEAMLIGAGPRQGSDYPQVEPTPASCAARCVIGRFPSEMPKLCYVEGLDNCHFEKPDNSNWRWLDRKLGEHRDSVEEFGEHRPFVIAWDNAHVYRDPERLDELARNAKRNNAQVIAVVGHGDGPSVIRRSSLPYFPVRIVMAPRLIPELELLGWMPWYELNNTAVPKPWEFPEELGTALISTGPANAPTLYRIAKARAPYFP